MENYANFHNELVEKIEEIEGVEDVKELFENPNKYGDINTHISFKHHIKDRWNYSKGELVFDYKSNSLFIPNNGSSILNNLDATQIIKQIKSYYKL